MPITNHYDLDIDTTLGGNNASDYVIPSQKAIKDYVDNSTGGNVMWGNITGTLSNQTDLVSALNNKYDASNPSGFITGITSSDVTTALGYTPYNSSNPNGYQANVIETVKVNGTALTVTSKAVDVTVPTKVSQLTNDSGYTTNTGTVTSVNNVSPVNGNVTLSIPSAQVNSDWNATSGVAEILNKPTIPTVNNATLTITQGGTTKGTFTANASSDVTIALDAGGTVEIDNTTITENSSDQLQTVAVIDNRSGSAIKTWTGTRQQYDAIVTKDANTLYNITDDDTSIGSVITDLNNKADTDLTNCSVPVVISRTSNNQGGTVEIWSDGYCVQTGILTVSSTTFTLNLDESYVDTNYLVYFSNHSGFRIISIGNKALNSVSGTQWNVSSGTAISESNTYYWETKGYIR